MIHATGVKLPTGERALMSKSPDLTSVDAGSNAGPRFTLQEILRQPDLWTITLDRVRLASEQLGLRSKLHGAHVLLTGAGTSAYAASAVASSWLRSVAIPTTDLLIDPERYLVDVDAVISLARSGDSPESAAVVERVRSLRPEIYQLAIVCNVDGALSHSELDGLITLDPRTNDHSLVMTSAFSGLKTLEMTAGRFPVISETYLGLRHGPMSFVKPETLVLCLLSSDPTRRLYEMDLIGELRTKRIGYLVGIADPQEVDGLFDEIIPAIAPGADDAMRTPYEIVGPQLLGYHLSLRIGLNPDNPSPEGIINRVVQGVRIHSANQNGHGHQSGR
jgi:fructoselysine-6-P-deglycase FrlB-like protein